jgi:hypothetical protein
MEDKQVYLFRKLGNPELGVNTHNEMSYICSEDARWDDVVRQFAAFLDSCGYVGVYERVDSLLYEYWEGK